MLIPFLLLLLLIVFPKDAAQGALQGLRLCARSVIPSLFPFLVVTRLLSSKLPSCRRLARAIGMDETVANAFLISLLGGYPIGVSTVCTLYEQGRLRKHEAAQAIVFCNNSGPGFFIGMVGIVVLKSIQKGLVLYLIHIFCAFLCARLFPLKKSSLTIRRCAEYKVSFSQAFTSAVSASAVSMLNICALVTLFSVFSSLLNALGVLSALPIAFQSLICGSLELTSGITMSANTQYPFVLCAFLMGWGGLCVHMQAISLWQAQGLCVKGYLSEKLLHGLLSALFAQLWLWKMPVFLVLVSICSIFCIISPHFSQKWGSKNKKVIV